MSEKIESVEERKDAFRVKLPYYDESGRRKYYSKTFSIKKYGTKNNAKKQAKIFRDQMKVRIANNLVVIPPKYTLEEVFRKQQELSSNTLGTKKKEIGTFNKYIKSYIGGDRIFSTIKFSDIQLNLNSLQPIAKDDTIIRAKSIWKKLYEYAIATSIVSKDETYNLKTPKSDIITTIKPMEISYDEFMDMINLLKNKRTRKRESFLIQGALWIMYYTGMRPSEVFALEKDDIDFITKNIYIHKAVGTNSAEENTIKRVKTSMSIRYIPIIDELEVILKELVDKTPNGYIFTRDNGELMNGTYMSDICRYLSDSKFRPYMLRHQFSTDLMRSGVDLRTIQELMGHKSKSMTLEYARSNHESKLNALKLRAKRFN